MRMLDKRKGSVGTFDEVVARAVRGAGEGEGARDPAVGVASARPVARRHVRGSGRQKRHRRELEYGFY